MVLSAPLDLSPRIADAVECTTCYMCACRCGINVHLKDGRVRFIEGNRNHPVNRGALCAKGAAGIMQHRSPARLRKPLKRIGPRGQGPFVEIEWDEALEIAASRLSAIRRSDPRKLAFFTGRDQSQALTSWWASQFGTPNYAAHGGFCSVNMAAAGHYTIGGSFWEFGEPDWERTRYHLMFGVAEDHASNPIKRALGQLKARGAKIVAVNPVRTGYAAIADEWIAIRPGTDGLFVLALVHELLRAGRIDLEYLVRYTNAPWLVIRDPGAPDDGLFARDRSGRPRCWDGGEGRAVDAGLPGIRPALRGEFRLDSAKTAVPAMQLVAERYLDPRYGPEAAAAVTGVSAKTIRRIAAEIGHVAFAETIAVETPWTDWAGRRHERFVGRPVSIHAMRGISAHSNGFHTCAALHLLQMLIGAIDCPGGFRYRPPYPKPTPPPVKPAGREGEAAPSAPLPGPPLGFPTGPGDLLVDGQGGPLRIDKAFSWEFPLAAHGAIHMMIANAWKGDPYPVDTLLLFMANMSWNSAMNTPATIRMLTDRDPVTGDYRIPYIVYADAYASEMVAYADLVLPDTTYLERYDCISLLDRPISDPDAAMDALRRPVVAPDRDVRPFQSVLIALGERLGLPGLVNADGSPRYPGGYADYIVGHERAPGVGLLAGWRGAGGDARGRGASNPRQIERYAENQGFWRGAVPEDGRFFKMANKGYLEWAAAMGFIATPEPIVLQLYNEPMQRFRLAARGHGPVQPPDALRRRIETYFDPLPFWYPPFEGAAVGEDRFPLHAITQRPPHMYHSWGAQNAWLRQITDRNRLFIHRRTAARLGLADGDWLWVESHLGRLKVQAQLTEGVEEHTVWTWNAIGQRPGAWGLSVDAGEGRQGFLLNHLISEFVADGTRPNADPVTGQAAWFDLRVRIVKAAGETAGEPGFAPQLPIAGSVPAPAVLGFGAEFRTRRTE